MQIEAMSIKIWMKLFSLNVWRSIVQIVAKFFYSKKCVCWLVIIDNCSVLFVFRVRVYSIIYIYANMLLMFFLYFIYLFFSSKVILIKFQRIYFFQSSETRKLMWNGASMMTTIFVGQYDMQIRYEEPIFDRVNQSNCGISFVLVFCFRFFFYFCYSSVFYFCICVQYKP